MAKDQPIIIINALEARICRLRRESFFCIQFSKYADVSINEYNVKPINILKFCWNF